MSDKPIALFNEHLVIDGDMTDDITSESVVISEARTIAAQFSWSDGSTPVGVFSLQCSNDDVNFEDVATGDISGATGNALINFDAPGFFHARLKYTSTSGSGTASGYLSAKS